MASHSVLLAAQKRPQTTREMSTRHRGTFIQAIEKELSESRANSIQREQSLTKQEETIVEGRKSPEKLSIKSSRKRRREEPTTDHPSVEQFELPRKRVPLFDQWTQGTFEGDVYSQRSFISHWAAENSWPKEYYKDDKMLYLLARKKSTSSIGRKRANSSVFSSVPGASDERPREEKSAPYRNPNYPSFLSEDVNNYKSYIKNHEVGISDASKKLLDELLHSKQIPPRGTLFDDDIFDKHCQKVRGRNESRILQDISPLLVPSAETFASFGSEHLNSVVESVNEGWNNCISITKTRPQPDSAFGYGITAFSDDQLNKLRPTLGDPSYLSYFKATFYMYFPFLTKEVKTGAMGLDIADNQNLHSATIAVRAVVELFKLVGREKELHREVIALTISHDDNSVKLYAHYPFIDGDKVTVWRHTVSRYFLDSETKWKTWIYTKNVFDIFSTMHLKRIRSAVDDISLGLNLDSQEMRSQDLEQLQQPLEAQNPISESSGLSQPLELQCLQEVETEIPDDQQNTLSTSFGITAGSPPKKKNKQRKDA